MGGWNAMTYDGRDTILRVVRRESEQFFDMAGAPAPGSVLPRARSGRCATTSGAWSTRPSRTSWGSTRRMGAVRRPDAYGLPGMAERVNTQARSLRGGTAGDLIEPARADYAKFSGILEDWDEQDWSGLIVPHRYMGPLPRSSTPPSS